MTERELYELFDRVAFYDTSGRGRFKPPVKLIDLAWVRIERTNGYEHEWWKDCIGVIFVAKLIFHQTPPTAQYRINFLYEVIPLKIKPHAVYVSRSIIANCVRVIELID